MASEHGVPRGVPTGNGVPRGVPIGNSPWAKRSRALQSQLPHSGGAECNAAVSAASSIGFFTATGSPIPVEDQMLLGKWRPGGPGTQRPSLAQLPEDLAPPAPAPPASAAAKALGSQNLRHNTNFLHDHGLEDGRNFLPVKNMIVDCNYQDALPKRVHMAATRSLERMSDHIAGQKTREAAQRQFSDDRFRRQRGTARLWADMQDTFAEIRSLKRNPGLSDGGRICVQGADYIPGLIPKAVQRSVSAPSPLGASPAELQATSCPAPASLVPELLTLLGTAGALPRSHQRKAR